MLINSTWNQKDALVTEDEYVGGDAGYWDTEFINVVKPISKSDLDQNPQLKDFNSRFNYERGLIEHTFAFLKQKFRIFDQPWRRHKELFPVALRVCLKLCNKYWRLDGNHPLGYERQWNQMEKEFAMDD